MSLFRKHGFEACKRLTEPVYKTPGCIREALNIYEVHENGIFEIEEPKGKEPHLFDRCYEFRDINFVDQDWEVQNSLSTKFCEILTAMKLDFKIISAGEPADEGASAERFYVEGGNPDYQEIDGYHNQLVDDAWARPVNRIQRKHYLVVTTEAADMMEAFKYFSGFDDVLTGLFESLGSELVPLDTVERLKSIRRYFFHEDMGEPLEWSAVEDLKRDWRNDVLPVRLENHETYLEFEDSFMRILFASDLPKMLNEETVVHDLTDHAFAHWMVLDSACIPKNVLKRKLESAELNNDMAINRELELNAKNGVFSGMPSMKKRQLKKSVEGHIEQVQENDENAYYVGILLAVTGGSREELEMNTQEVINKAKNLHIRLKPYHHQQLQALNTALPVGCRMVSYMRPLLTTSFAAFQPFYAYDLMQSDGYLYGINRKTGRPIFGNRKTLNNGNGVIIGHTGSGKSMLLKLTEIGQTMVRTSDDIFMIDPQNEMKKIAPVYNGMYFDLSGEEPICLNPLEIPDQLLKNGDEIARRKFTEQKKEFVEAFLYALVGEDVPAGLYKPVIYRCIETLYQQIWEKKKPKSPVLSDLRNLFKEQEEQEAQLLYKALEPFTEYGNKMLCGQSTFQISSRFVAFGMKGLSSQMWEPVMLTIMHLLSQRIDYNVKLQKATHFIVDEAQYVCNRESSCEELEKAFLTYRKYGGICTICLQNTTSAMANPKISNIVSNSDFKVFLDQGGSDRNYLASILSMSEQEFKSLAAPGVGQCLLVWGKRILQCDSRISNKNKLYEIYNTDFHNKRY